MTVAEILTAARASHAEYRRLAATPPKPSGWQRALWDAYTLRLQAERQDPDRLDPAWDADRADHASLMHFYRQQLGIAG